MEAKDGKLSEALDTKFSTSPFYMENRKHRNVGKQVVFSIMHYAGQVCYNVEGFVVKNMDTLFPDLYELMSNSQTKV